MTPFEHAVGSIRGGDPSAAETTRRLLDAKTKPVGSLGRLEELAVRVAWIRGAVPDHVLEPAIVVAAADHGVALEGVSAYPREVTGQMVRNLATGGAAVSVLAREAGARLVVVDCGVDTDEPFGAPVVDATLPGIRGTGDLSLGPAMSRGTAVAMVERGIALATELARDGVEIVGLGEMGIGNTTSASAIVAAISGVSPATVCGPGTGLDAEGIARKVEVVGRALDANGLREGTHADPLDVLAGVGGLEIAFLVGVALGAASSRVVVLLDGAITGAAALLAARISPRCVDAMIAATRSPEPAHDIALRALGLEPLLDLGLRLGEGSGAALALALVRAAVAIVTDMATFADAGVSERRDGALLRGA